MPLADDFLLVSLSPDDGRPLVGPVHLQCGLAAAMLVELARAGRIDLDGEVVTVRDAAPLGLPQEDAVLARLAGEGAHDLRWWIGDLRRGVVEGVTARLVGTGVLTEERVRRLGIVPEVRHRPVDPAAGAAVRERLAAVLDHGAADADGLALLAIAHATGLDKALFPAVDPATVEHRIDEVGNDAVGAAVATVVRHVLAAVVAVLAAVTAAM